MKTQTGVLWHLLTNTHFDSKAKKTLYFNLIIVWVLETSIFYECFYKQECVYWNIVLLAAASTAIKLRPSRQNFFLVKRQTLES